MIDDAEKKSLEVHVVACGERYRTIFNRVRRIEGVLLGAVVGLIGAMWWVIQKLADIHKVVQGVGQ